MELTTMFGAGKITRPLLSVHMMIENGHEVKFSLMENSIKLKGMNEKIKPRKEGRLFVLDLWVRVPVDVARTSPFVRKVAQA